MEAVGIYGADGDGPTAGSNRLDDAAPDRSGIYGTRRIRHVSS
jgi:hypothetical protein